MEERRATRRFIQETELAKFAEAASRKLTEPSRDPLLEQQEQLELMKKVGLIDLILDVSSDLQQIYPNVEVYQSIPSRAQLASKILIVLSKPEIVFGENPLRAFVDNSGLNIHVDDITCTYIGPRNYLSGSEHHDSVIFSRVGIKIPLGDDYHSSLIKLDDPELLQKADSAIAHALKVPTYGITREVCIPRKGAKGFFDRFGMREDPKIKIFPTEGFNI